MKNMKISKAEHPMSMDEAFYQGQAQYPSGLRICLEPAVIEKLQLGKMPEVGEMLGLHAVVEVVAVNLENAADGSRNKRIELQITDLELQNKVKDGSEEEKTILG